MDQPKPSAHGVEPERVRLLNRGLAPGAVKVNRGAPASSSTVVYRGSLLVTKVTHATSTGERLLTFYLHHLFLTCGYLREDFIVSSLKALSAGG